VAVRRVDVSLNGLLKCVATYVDVFNFMFSLQVLLEVVLPGPVFELILTLALVTSVDNLASSSDLVDA
jgi:hypothetical protein